ncbi:MAG: hypothetical protein KGN01_06500, partial [Patescibacteria group bacterium]|nr:hypothetical protein [Patescibacteria group bacterium]
YHLEPNTPLHDEIKDNNLAQEQLLSALRQARLAAFDEVLAVLPDEDRKINIEDSNTVWPHFGWNAYRSEAIEAINKLREV